MISLIHYCCKKHFRNSCSRYVSFRSALISFQLSSYMGKCVTRSRLGSAVTVCVSLSLIFSCIFRDLCNT